MDPGRRFAATRRDFLKLVGASMGCMLLSSCSSGSGAGGASNPIGGGATGPPSAPSSPIPNGYAFSRLYTPGDPILPNVATLTPHILMDDANHVFFYAQDAQNNLGLYELTVDYTQSTPTAVAARTLVAAGQVMPDGRVVSTVGSTDVNASGHMAMVLNFDAGLSPQGAGLNSIVMDQGQGLVTLFDYGDAVAGNNGQYSEFGDLDLAGDNLLFVSRYGGGGQVTQGVIFAPGEVQSAATIVATSNQEVPNADGTINSIGLIDLDDNGDYVAQAFGTPPLSILDPNTAPPLAPLIVHGNVRQSLSEARLLAASPHLSLTRAGTDGTTAVGMSLYAPRIGGSQITSIVTEDSSGNTTLYRAGAIVAQSGMLSPGGNSIQGIVPGVVNASGLIFYELVTNQGLELCVSNGQMTALLLNRGATIGGLAVDTIAFGLHPTQADAGGRLVSYGQMLNGPETILLGIPV